ncbi:copper homeostasis protein CutC [Bacteroidales bacterium]
MSLLEICADGLESAIAASVGGAHRIELCANLEAGGLTPSAGMLKVVSERVAIPVNVLIRPRRGDYVYTAAYVDVMLNDIITVKELGLNGVVVGVLDKNGRLERSQMNEILDAAKGLSVTFHRAIDVAADPLALLGQLVELGVERVLTSGGKPTAMEGMRQIALFQKEFGQHIRIMAGSGVNAQNAATLIHETGISEIHSSAKKTVHFTYSHQPWPQLVTDDWYFESDYHEIKALLKAVENI